MVNNSDFIKIKLKSNNFFKCGKSMNENLILYLTVYLLSSVPFGFILAFIFAKVDVRKEGSGNIGATNVLRVVKEKDEALAKKLAIVTFALDFFKGIVVLLIALYLEVPESVLWTIAILAVMGHCFSIFLGFDGGKGVATAFGVMFIMMPISSAISITTWFIFTKFFKIVSLSSIIAILSFLIASYLVTNLEYYAPIWIISSILIYKHIPNISRLIFKQEKQVL